MVFFAVALAVSASAIDATFSYGYTDHATALRSALLTGYDRAVPPRSVRDPAQNYTSEAGTDVSVQIRFFKVESIEAAAGSMRLKVWFRLSWTDDRLAWNASQYGGISTIWFNPPDPGYASNPEIWVPDLTIYNTRVGVSSTLDPAHAIAYSTGSVFWSRPGVVDIMCKFQGLGRFPFDNLACPLELGGWIIGGGHQGITLSNGGYSFSTQEVTAGSSYQEYSIAGVNASVVLYTYECCPNDPYPVVTYTITLDRASFYYVSLVIVPIVCLTVLSFGVFFMSFEVGERLGYGITLLLALEVTKIVVMGYVPVCGETLWIDQFMLVHTAFATIALLETCFTLFLAFHTDDHLIPSILMPPRWVLVKIASLCGMPEPSIELKRDLGETGVGDIFREFATAKLEEQGTSDTPAGTSKGLQVPPVAPSTPPFVLAQGSSSPSKYPRPFLRQDTTWIKHSPKVVKTFERLQQQRPLTQDDTLKVVFFEKLFFQIDDDSNGYVYIADMERMLSFMAVHSTYEERYTVLRAVDDEGDGLIQQDEFVQACLLLLWNVPQVQLQWAADNFTDAVKNRYDRNKMYWMKAARQVDRMARLWIISAYAITLGWVFTLEIDDNYDKPAPDDGSKEMHEGMGPHSNTGWIAFAPSLVAVAILLFCWQSYFGSPAQRKAREQRQAVRRRVHKVAPDSYRMPSIAEDGASDENEATGERGRVSPSR